MAQYKVLSSVLNDKHCSPRLQGELVDEKDFASADDIQRRLEQGSIELVENAQAAKGGAKPADDGKAAKGGAK